jgi:hypothetical protein
VITLPKPAKGPKAPQNLRPISFLSAKSKLFEKALLKDLPKSYSGKASATCKSIWLSCMSQRGTSMYKVADHVTLKFNNDNMSKTEKLLDI